MTSSRASFPTFSPSRVIYTEVMPSKNKAKHESPRTGWRSKPAATSASSNRAAPPVQGQGLVRSAAGLASAPVAQHDASTDIGRAAAWLFATAPRGSDRIAGKIHLAPPSRERSLFLSRQGEVLMLQRRDERGSARGVAITASQVLWNGIELPRRHGDFDAATAAETRVMGRLQQALNGLMRRRNAPAPFTSDTRQVETAAPPLPPKQYGPAKAGLHSILVSRVAANGPAGHKPIKRVTFQLPQSPTSRSASHERLEQTADRGLPAQQVARPFGVHSLLEAHEFVKAGLQLGFDEVVDVGEAQRYRVRVDARGTLIVDAEHAPASSFVVDREGTLRFANVVVDDDSGPATLRISVERMNAALQAVKRQSDRRPAR